MDEVHGADLADVSEQPHIQFLELVRTPRQSSGHGRQIVPDAVMSTWISYAKAAILFR